MARRGTLSIPNNTYYLTFTILGWRKLFINDEYCQSVTKWFDYCRENYKNKIQGYVIMPDHIHVLMYITGQSPHLPVLIMNAKRFISYELVKLLQQDKHFEILKYFSIFARTKYRAHHKLFTDGYDSLIIQSQKFFLQKLNYIHNNPVRAGLVKEPEAYRYSSASNYTNGVGYNGVDIVDF